MYEDAHLDDFGDDWLFDPEDEYEDDYDDFDEDEDDDL